jgi:putative membrane protein
VTAHQQAVDMFRNYSQSGDTPQLKQWAAKTLPDLQQHLQMAQSLQQTVKG